MRTLESAKWWKRLTAIVYDTLIVTGLLMIAGFAVLALNGVHAVPPNTLWYQIYLVAIVWAYFAISWWRVGKTVGSWKCAIWPATTRAWDAPAGARCWRCCQSVCAASACSGA